MQTQHNPNSPEGTDDTPAALVTSLSATNVIDKLSVRLSYHWRIDGTQPENFASGEPLSLVGEAAHALSLPEAEVASWPITPTSPRPWIFDIRIAPSDGPVGETFSLITEVGGTSKPVVSVQWLLDGSPIEGATDLRYTSTAEGALAVRVTTAAAGAGDDVTSGAAVVRRRPVAPTLTMPIIEPASGTVGDQFKVSAAPDGYPDPQVTFQWLLDGKPVAGATNNTVSALAPGQLSVEVTAQNTEGTVTQTSGAAAVARPVVPMDPAPETPPESGAWTPANLSVPPIWFDATDLAGSESTGTWRSKLGGIHVAEQPDAARRPVLVSNSLAGKPVLDFDGVNDFLTIENAPQLGTGFSIFVVSRTRSLGSARTIAARWGSGTDGDWILDTTQTDARFLVRNKGYLYANGAAAQDTNFHIHGAVWADGVATSFLDGRLGGTAASGATSLSSTAPLNLGARASSAFCPLSLAEVIVVPAALSEAERQNIEAYLARKWNLLHCLPADHPARLASAPAEPDPQPQPAPADPLPGTVPDSAPAPTQWTPSELPSLAGWFDASDASTPTGGALATWQNKAGVMAAAQATPSCQPTLTREGERAVVRFDGVDDSLLLAAAPQPATGLTLVMVARTRVNDPGTPVNYASNYDGANGDWILGPLGGYKSRLLVRSDNANHAVTLGGAADTAFHILGGSSAGGVSTAFCDGLVGTPVVHGIPAISANSVRLGSRTSGSASPVDICEVIVLSGAISGSDRVRLEGYLAHKWDLQDRLPAEHAFKVRAPLQGEAVAAPQDPAVPKAAPWVAAGSLLSVSVPPTVFIPPGATEVHIPMTASGPISFTAWTRVAGLQNISGGGFNVGNSTAQATWIPPYDFFWRDGDDPVHWATIKINAPDAVRNTPGNKFRVSFAGLGWDNANGSRQQIGSTVVEVQEGAVNSLPTRMPHHRPPKLISFPGEPAARLDIPAMQWSDNGYVGNPPLQSGTLLPVDPKAAPCWRTRLYHGYGQAGNGELGAYLNTDAFPNDAVEPISKGTDSAGRPFARLHTRRLANPVTVNGTAYNFQATVINSQSMDQWSARTGVYRAQLQTPDRVGAWSAFWTFGRRTSTRGGAWPPEIDFFEHFNGAYGLGSGATDWNMSGALTSAGQHCGPFASNNRPRAVGLKTDLRRLGHAADLNLYTQIHDYACLITEERIYHFIDGIETVSMPNMAKHEDPNNTDWDYGIYLNVAVKPPSATSAYADGSGDMLIYGLERYDLDAGYSVDDWTAPRPWQNRGLQPDPN